jgi:hypothetical protein
MLMRQSIRTDIAAGRSLITSFAISGVWWHKAGFIWFRVLKHPFSKVFVTTVQYSISLAASPTPRGVLGLQFA